MTLPILALLAALLCVAAAAPVPALAVTATLAALLHPDAAVLTVQVGAGLVIAAGAAVIWRQLAGARGVLLVTAR